MSALSLNSLNCSENEFLAEEELIVIRPTINHATLNLVSGDFGPLQIDIPCTVPLWLAIFLRKRGKCIIIVPEWLKVANLENCIQQERVSSTLGGSVPFHYLEIAHLLLENAKDDIPSYAKVAVLLEDLENIRMDRIKLGVMSVAGSVSEGNSVVTATLNNVAALEILTMKSFFVKSMNTFYWLCPPAAPLPDPTDSRREYDAAVEDTRTNQRNTNQEPRQLRRFKSG